MSIAEAPPKFEAADLDAGELYEVIDGVRVEMPPVSTYAALVANEISQAITAHAAANRHARPRPHLIRTMIVASPDKTPLAILPNGGPAIDYELVLDCVHCGLCTSACPTYVENGLEADSPRGRIYLMRNVIDGQLALDESVKGHLDLCLNCRACETACPSGVQYGKLIEPFRIAMEQTGEGKPKSGDWFHRWILFRLFPYPKRMRAALAPARLAQRLRLDRLAEALGLLS